MPHLTVRRLDGSVAHAVAIAAAVFAFIVQPVLAQDTALLREIDRHRWRTTGSTRTFQGWCGASCRTAGWCM